MPRSQLGPIANILFFSRWLQLPLYLGLIVAQAVYVWYFMVELTHLVEAAFGSKDALEMILKNVTPAGAETVKAPPETLVMLVVLGLIDVVMISNLLIMVIVGGYETFVSRMRLEGHPDQPEWLSHVNASVLKVKLATAIIGDLVDPPAEDVHQREFVRREGADRADHDPRDVPALRARRGGGRPHHAAGPRARGERRGDRRSRRPLTYREQRMATIRQDDFIASVADALQFISYYHPQDYIDALGEAYRAEESPAAKDAIAQILTNSRMCAEGHRPICQDTGIVVAFVKVGMNVRWDGVTMSIADMVDDGVRRAYLDPDNTLRASIVADPAGARKNTRDNTPAVVHVDLVPGDTVDVKIAAKGGGSENKAKFAMLNPSDSIVDWVLKTVPTMGAGWCPPGMLGIGIGGTAEKAMVLAKEALMEPHRHPRAPAARPGQRDGSDAPRALRQGQRARHRRAGPGRPLDGARRQDPRLSDACGVEARRHDPELRRHAPCAFHAGRLGCGEARSPRSRALARRAVDAVARPRGASISTR